MQTNRLRIKCFHLPHLFPSNELGGGGWSWMEVEMGWMGVDGARWSWVEVDGAGWSWMHGLVIPKTILIIFKFS